MAQNMRPKATSQSHDANSDLRAQALKDAVRRLMKIRGKSYQDLADHLSVSLATVKRILNQEEMALSRLIVICEWLGISLADLDAAADRAPNEETQYSEEQELFLASDPRYLVYLYHLWDGLSPTDIAKKFGLKKASTDRYLIRLEKLGLVRTTGKGRVLPLHRKQPNWRPGGALSRTHYDRLTTRFMGFFSQRVREVMDHPETVPEGTMRSTMNSGTMSRETYLAMAKELREVVKRYEDASHLESRIYPEDSVGTYALLLCNTWLDPGRKPTELESVFGEVTDL